MHKLLLCAFFVLLSACSDKPSRARFPGPIGRTADMQQAQKTKEVLGGFDPTAAQKNNSENAIRGVVRLKKGLKIPTDNYMIFISARSLGGGPPLAALRLSPRKIPFRFALTQANTMMQGTVLEGYVELTVRISQPKEDGSFDPLTRQKGDLSGSKRVKVGVKDIDVEISEIVK